MTACGPVPPRLRWVSSQATQASWSFVVDDRARGAELLVDGRARDYECNRAGRTLRCELHGLFPGGHTVELRLPGAILRRSVVVGRDWPTWPALVRVRSPDDAREAAEAGADAVVADGTVGMVDLQDIAEAAHARGARLLVQGDARAVDLAGADGVIGAGLPAELKERFPEAMTLAIDERGSATLGDGSRPSVLLDPAGRSFPEALARLHDAEGLVEAHGLVAAALAHLAPHGAIVDRSAFPLLSARKRHKALRGAVVETFGSAVGRLGLLLRAGGDEVALVINGSAEVWALTPPAPNDPIDLLGSHVEHGAVTLRPGDVALLVRSPAPDRTRF
jgi:hypothetical protein